MTEAFYHMEGG